MSVKILIVEAEVVRTGQDKTIDDFKNKVILAGGEVILVKRPGNPVKYFISLLFSIPRADVVYHVVDRTRLSFYLKNFPVFVCAFVFKKRVFSHVVGRGTLDFFSRLCIFEKFIWFKLMNRSDSIIVLGNNMRAEFFRVEIMLNKIFKPKFYSVPYFVDLPGSYKQPLPSKSDKHVIFASDLIPAKGVEVFFELVQSVRERCKIDSNYSGLKFTIAGSIPSSIRGGKPTRQGLEARCHELGIDMVGRLSIDGLRSLFCRADILIFPSTFSSESLPLTIVEAARLGVFTIAYDVGEIGSFFAANLVMVTPASKPKDLISAFYRVVEDKNVFTYESKLTRSKLMKSIDGEAISKADKFIKDVVER